MNRALTVAASAIAGAALTNSAPALGVIAPIGARLAPRLVGVGRRGHTALTFDDGPDSRSTNAILDCLAHLGVRATFFVLAPNVERAPQVARRIIADGHEIAVHGYRHQSALVRTARQLTDDIRRTIGRVEDTTGIHPRWYRPPYGHLTLAAWHVACEHDLQTVLWTAWGRDWRRNATPSTIMADLHRGTLDGGTVLLHDSDCTSAPGSWRNTLGAVPLLAAHLEDRHLEIGPLSEHW